ncbi:hypothetical protein WHZ77_15140 [Bradyrhizobium sp. A5]|uniref:hypothetical protein n=1 Tax=Bradyrhizobium sp. A5 TaxID=3133696 RepID=UPI003243F45D
MDQPFRDTRLTDVYGAFEFRARSVAAKALVNEVYDAILNTETRRRKRRENDAKTFYVTVERFVGELLHAKASNGTGRFSRSLSKKGFLRDVVTLENVNIALEGLKKLDYVHHTPGYAAYGPSFDDRTKTEHRPGEAAKFEATPALIDLASRHGIKLTQIQRHFAIEHQPLEARTSKGRKVPIKRTPLTKQMEELVVAINRFIDGFTIGGADHRMFYRLFNQCDDLSTYRWDRGGRLYSDSGTERPSYQSMSSKPKEDRELRSNITIDGEPVIELDIAGSYLCIFHALAGQPLLLAPDEDPYARVQADRDLVKAWMTFSFGAGKACGRWPKEFTKRYAEEHDGIRPGKVGTAPDIETKAKEAFPALKHIGSWGLEWGNLMFVESEIILWAIENLMQMEIPALPMHDALIVPASDAAEGARALYQSFYHKVGVCPVIKTKSGLPGIREAVAAVGREFSGLPPKAPMINTRADEA